MSSSKLRRLKSIFNGGCGCDPKATDIIEHKSKSEAAFSDQKFGNCPPSSDSAWMRHGGQKSFIDDEGYTSTTFSLNNDACRPAEQQDDGAKCPKTSSFSRSSQKIRDSFAIVKESEDPYRDFQESMLQMIFENEIYSWNGLRQLLDCFLRLNLPAHHEVIIRAFLEICNGGIPATEGG